MIELDVIMTRDRQVVVIHDDSVDRTTNGKGMVADYDFNDLAKLDAGTWFHPRFAGERIPTLKGVFEALGKDIGINIEIKESAVEKAFPTDSIERQVAQIIASQNAWNRVIVSSFNWDCIKRFREMEPQCAIGVLSQGDDGEKAIPICRHINAFSWHPDAGAVTPQSVARGNAAGLRVIPYTVNDPADMRRMLDLCVDGFFTDDPVAARNP